MELTTSQGSNVLKNMPDFQDGVVIVDDSFLSVYIFSDPITDSQCLDIIAQINASLDEEWLFKVKLLKDGSRCCLEFIWTFSEDISKGNINISSRTSVFNKTIEECLELVPESVRLHRLCGNDLLISMSQFYSNQIN